MYRSIAHEMACELERKMKERRRAMIRAIVNLSVFKELLQKDMSAAQEQAQTIQQELEQIATTAESRSVAVFFECVEDDDQCVEEDDQCVEEDDQCTEEGDQDFATHPHFSPEVISQLTQSVENVGVTWQNFVTTRAHMEDEAASRADRCSQAREQLNRLQELATDAKMQGMLGFALCMTTQLRIERIERSPHTDDREKCLREAIEQQRLYFLQESDIWKTFEESLDEMLGEAQEFLASVW
jgi:hypothetical protein